MIRRSFVVLSALALMACASQSENAAPKPAASGSTRTLQDLNGSRIAMPVGLFLTSLDADRDLSVSSMEVRDGAADSFEASDTNRDGHLSPIEFEDWSRTYLGSEYTTPGRLQFDRDLDTLVSRQEFMMTFDAIQQRLDTDQDGTLARSELLVEINGVGVDPEAVRSQIEAEMRRNMQGKVREMCQRGGRGM